MSHCSIQVHFLCPVLLALDLEGTWSQFLKDLQYQHYWGVFASLQMRLFLSALSSHTEVIDVQLLLLDTLEKFTNTAAVFERYIPRKWTAPIFPDPAFEHPYSYGQTLERFFWC